MSWAQPKVFHHGNWKYHIEFEIEDSVVHYFYSASFQLSHFNLRPQAKARNSQSSTDQTSQGETPDNVQLSLTRFLKGQIGRRSLMVGVNGS